MKNQLVSLVLNVGVREDNEVIKPKDLLEAMLHIDLNVLDAEVTAYHLQDVDSGIETGMVLYDVDGDPYVPEGEDGDEWNEEYR